MLDLKIFYSVASSKQPAPRGEDSFSLPSSERNLFIETSEAKKNHFLCIFRRTTVVLPVYVLYRLKGRKIIKACNCR